MIDRNSIKATGFGGTNEICPDEVEACKRFLAEHIRPTQEVQRQFGSYRLKHLIERHANSYISNGAAIVAAIELGYPVERIAGSLNARLGMSLFDLKSQQAITRGHGND